MSVQSRLSIFLLLVFAMTPSAHAWSYKAHRVIGELAERQLSPSTRRSVQTLLADEPTPGLAAVSTWADELRGDERWRHTARWHFMNFPRGECRYQAHRDCADGHCIVSALDTQRALLRDPSTPHPQRIEALKFVVHFVGDIHQPLHAGYGFDRGGNDTQIRFNRMGSNLHSLWDGLLIDSLELDPPALLQHLAQRSPPAPGAVGGNASVRWAEQSCALIESTGLYPDKRFIDRAYVERMRPLAEAQMRLAAARLAAVLEADLGQ